MNPTTKFFPKKEVVIIVGFIFCITHGYAQHEYDLLGKGGRAAGMGYAFTAIADDATVMSWNPGAMVQIKKPELAVVNSLKVTNQKQTYWSANQYTPVYTFDYAGLVYPLIFSKNNLVFGVDYRNRINYKLELVRKWRDSDKHAKKNVTINAVSTSIAYSFTRFLGLGLSLSIWFSLGNEANIYEHYNTREIYGSSYYDQTIYNVSEKYSYSGHSATAGMLLDFSCYKIPLRFALKYESPHVLANDYNYDFQKRDYYHNNIDTLFSLIYNVKEDTYLPGILTMGISYRIGDYFTIAADYDRKPFKDNFYIWDYDEVYSYMTNDQSIVIRDTSYHENYYLLESNNDLHQFRIGLEYVLHPKFACIPIRAGWKNNPTSLSNYKKVSVNDSLVIVKDKQVFAYSLNVGLGIAMKRFSIDLAYERYQFSRDRRIGSFSDDLQTEKDVLHFFTLSAIWYIK
ncbi:MAG: UPF0164 family protein [Bacteroidales bacterium]|nr:UPF0164 family protein [Bacteroidales bacterium]